MDYKHGSQKQPQSKHEVDGNQLPGDFSFPEAVVCIILLACFVVYITIAMFFSPIPPSFFVQSVDVPHLNISSSPSQIDTIWNINFWITNPSMISEYYYKNIKVSIVYKGELLSSTTMASFLLSKRGTAAPAVVINASRMTVKDQVAFAIKTELIRVSVGFNFMVDATVRSYPGIWPLHNGKMKVLCEDLLIGFLPDNTNGTLLGRSRECRVYLHF